MRLGLSRRYLPAKQGSNGAAPAELRTCLSGMMSYCQVRAANEIMCSADRLVTLLGIVARALTISGLAEQ